jgi:hypothetical protein
MYCSQCNNHYFGGSICPECGRRLERGKVAFSRWGQALIFGDDTHGFEQPLSESGEGDEIRHDYFTRLLKKLSRKFFESVFACAILSLTIRVAVYVIRVIDILMEGRVYAPSEISFIPYLKMPLSGFEIAGWIILTALIFRYRHDDI